MSKPRKTDRKTDGITMRKPTSTDGAAIWSLIKDCAPLDENSMYFNLIQCDHFAGTCVLAELDGAPVGWISGHMRPDEPDTLFVWQVAVSPEARGRGLGGRMLTELMNRDACDGMARIQTTITKDNDASWALFEKFADRQDADMESRAHFNRDDHFDGEHDTEHMVTITLTEEEMKSAA